MHVSEFSKAYFSSTAMVEFPPKGTGHESFSFLTAAGVFSPPNTFLLTEIPTALIMFSRILSLSSRMWSYSALAATSSVRPSSETAEHDGPGKQEDPESEPFMLTSHLHKGQRHRTKSNWRAIAFHVVLTAANIALLAVLALQITKLHGRQHVLSKSTCLFYRL